jgi:hypothetical protein
MTDTCIKHNMHTIVFEKKKKLMHTLLVEYCRRDKQRAAEPHLRKICISI